MTTTTHPCVTLPGKAGVQGEGGKVEDCPVQVNGHLRELLLDDVRKQKDMATTAAAAAAATASGYRDKVQFFDFDQFCVTTERRNGPDGASPVPVPLNEWMNKVKAQIEAKDKDAYDDDDEYYSASDKALLDLHDTFIPIVRQILGEYQFFQSGLGDFDLNDICIKKFAHPNYRKASDPYAN